jgi:hypothetical protein
MTTPTPPASGFPEPLRLFRLQPRRLKRAQALALRSGHVCCGAGCPEGCEPVLVREPTRWGWIDWTVPAEGSQPLQPDRIAVFGPLASRAQCLRLRWLARRPARRIRFGPLPLRPATAAVTVLALIAATLATLHGIPLSIVFPTAALAPLLAEHLPDVLDARAGYLHRLAILHATLTDAAAHRDHYPVRRPLQIGHHQLFDTADLLQRHDTRSFSAQLITRERLMMQLAAQTTDILTPTAGDATSACPGQPGGQLAAPPNPPRGGPHPNPQCPLHR